MYPLAKTTDSRFASIDQSKFASVTPSI